MNQEGDPFPQAEADLELLLRRSRDLQKKFVSNGFVSAVDLQEIRELYADSVEILGILKYALFALDENGGKINGNIFSANDIVERQNAVKSFENDVEALQKLCATLSTREEAVSSSLQQRKDSDNFLQLQHLAQKDEIAQQEEIMDRLSHGLQELRETGINVNSELRTQNVLLVDVDSKVSSLQARLRSANERVDQLLNSLSNKGKICTICMLLGVIFLLYLLF